MRRLVLLAALCAGAPLAISSAAAPLAAERAVITAETIRPVRNKRRAASHAGGGRYRSKNAPTRRKLRSNRLHISRRVRRKHRRAA